MDIRQLNLEERLEALQISAVAFHWMPGDPEKQREELARKPEEDWGAFAEDGRLMAHIINNHFEVHFDGSVVPCGGVGAVSTLPEYRREGAIRKIFARLLPEAYRRGEVFSALYPFNHGFYRKAGYETSVWRRDWSFPASVLRGYCFDGAAEPWRPGLPAEEYTALYGAFARGFNLAVVRDGARMLGVHLEDDGHHADRRFAYLLREGSRAVAYVIYRDRPGSDGRVLAVEEAVWDGRAGFEALLGFLARFSADFGRVELPLPDSVDLYRVIRAEDLYEIGCRPRQGFMARVVHVERALTLMCKGPDCDFTLRTEDPWIPENTGCWHVTAAGAERTEGPADLTVSLQALSLMLLGRLTPEEAALRADVEFAGTGVLDGVFTRRPMLVLEDF